MRIRAGIDMSGRAGYDDAMSTAELQKLVAELARSTKELRTSQQETDRQMKETDRKMQETDQKIKSLSGLFTSQWGKLVEALMRPGTVQLFQERGVRVSQMTERRTGLDKEGREIEVDMTLVDHGTIVVVEVKTTCKVEDITWHLDKLGRFKEAFGEYANWAVQGALAAIRFEEESDRHAYRNGLWVLKCQDGITGIANSKSFKPRIF
jgi:light-regulated signal transduction histidine kinase (bacteriophytochrome)